MHGVDAFQFLMSLLWVSAWQLVTLLKISQAELPAVDLLHPTALAFLVMAAMLHQRWRCSGRWLLSDAGFCFPNPALFLDFEDDVDSA